MEPGVFIFVLIVGAIIAMVVWLGRGRNADQAWAEVARRWRFRFESGGLLKGRVLSGTLDGLRVVVDTHTRGSGNSSRTYTRYRVRFRRPLGLGLRLAREGFFSGVGKLFGSQDIETGDAGFDDEVLVKGRDPARVRSFLSAERRARIRQFLQSKPQTVISDSEVRWERRGVVTDSAELAATARTLVRLAKLLTERVEEELAEEPGRGSGPPPEGRAEAASTILGVAAAALLERRRAEEAIRPPPLPAEAAAGGGTERAAEPEPEPEPEPESGTSTTPAPIPSARPGVDLGVDSVCGALFATGGTSLDADRLFKERYEGLEVDWSGTLRSADHFSYDFVLGSEPGTKAVFEVYEVKTGTYGDSKVVMVVGLPESAEAELRERVGERLRLHGRLVRADGFLRTLYLSEARVEGC